MLAEGIACHSHCFSEDSDAMARHPLCSSPSERGLPDACHSVAVKLFIRADNGQVVGGGLSDQQAVKWIAVVKGERRDNCGMTDFDGQHLKSGPIQPE